MSHWFFYTDQSVQANLGDGVRFADNNYNNSQVVSTK